MRELFKKWLMEFVWSLVAGIAFLALLYYTMFIVYVFGG
jgi:hypothetical protein